MLIEAEEQTICPLHDTEKIEAGPESCCYLYTIGIKGLKVRKTGNCKNDWSFNREIKKSKKAKGKKKITRTLSMIFRNW